MKFAICVRPNKLCDSLQVDMGSVGSSTKELRGTVAAQKCWSYGRPCGLLGPCTTPLDP